MLLLMFVSLLAGFLTVLSPCILPILPAVLASSTTLRPLATILGLVCSFSFFTLALTSIVQVTGISPALFKYIAISLIFLFGLVMLFPRLSDWFAVKTSRIASLGTRFHPSKGFWGGFLFGIALGLIWTPCAGPILASITALIATQGITWTALLMTIAYCVGAGVPLFFIAYGGQKILHTSRVLSRYSERIRQFFGLLMVLFAFLLLFNWEILLNEKLARVAPKMLTEKTVEEPILGPAPELTGITGWINSPPLTLEGLRGKVILLDFWTYTCINCIRTIPHLEKLYKEYKDRGFVVIGVHTPQFEFEKDFNNVKKAVDRFDITYPVALDNNYATWEAYQNRYWPSHYLIDQQGNIRMVQYGEGGYVKTENAIRSLLGLPPLLKKEAILSERDLTSEIYLGADRADKYQNETIYVDRTFNYSYSGPLAEDHVGLKGQWKVEKDCILAVGDSALDLNFLASDVYLVLCGREDQGQIEVILDGIRQQSVKMDGDRKYDIVHTNYGRHLLSLKIPSGIRAYVFTFGDYTENISKINF